MIKCAVVLLVNSSTDGLSELVAFYESDEEVSSSTIAQFLANRLPVYMIPKRFIKLAFIPRNDRGKIDREKVIEQWINSKEDDHIRVH